MTSGCAAVWSCNYGCTRAANSLTAVLNGSVCAYLGDNMPRIRAVSRSHNHSRARSPERNTVEKRPRNDINPCRIEAGRTGVFDLHILPDIQRIFYLRPVVCLVTRGTGESVARIGSSECASEDRK